MNRKVIIERVEGAVTKVRVRQVCHAGGLRFVVWVLALAITCGVGPQWLGSGQAAAEEVSEEERTERSKAFYIEGREAFMKNDWSRAVEKFKQAYELRDVPKLLQFIAQAYDHMGKIGETLRYLELYAATSEEASAEVAEQIAILRPIVVRQMVLSASSELADAVALATPGRDSGRIKRVSVDLDGPVFDDVPYAFFSEPPGATVYLNDKEWGEQGKTPHTMRLFPGRHVVWVEKDYHIPVQTEIVIKPVTSDSKPQELRVKLEREVVPVSIRARPETAEIVFISADGERRKLGVGRWEGRLPAGPARFLVQATNLGQREFEEIIRGSAVDETGSQSFVLNLRGGADVNQELLGRSGTANITSTGVDGEVFIDGKFIGRVPGTVTRSLSPGRHRVELRAEGYYPWTTEIEVKPDETLDVSAPSSLAPIPVKGPNIGGIILTTTGAATALAGGLFTFSALQPDTLSILDDKDAANLTGYVLYGVGGVALATGLVLFAVDDDDPAPEAGLMLSPLPDGGWAVSFGGAFE